MLQSRHLYLKVILWLRSLLMRLYDVTEGEIAYRGINIKDFPIKNYRDNIGFVFQDYQMYVVYLYAPTFL